MKMPIRSRRSRALATLGLIVLSGAGSLGAQEIHGELTEAGTGVVIRGAFVILLDESGRQIDIALTDAGGRFQLVAERSGSYSLGLDRIGYFSTRTDAIPLASGEKILYRLTTVVEPVEL